MGDAEEPAGDEGDVLKVWFSRLEEAVLSAGDFSLRVCDSQRASWLPQHDSCVSSTYLKPDGFVIHEAYLDDVSQPRKPAHKRLFPFLRSVIEGKAKVAWGNMAMGEAIQYRGVSRIRNGGAGRNKQLGPDCLLPARNKQLAKFRVFRLPT